MGDPRVREGLAGAVGTVVMTLEQRLDKRPFDSKYDDVEILGQARDPRRRLGARRRRAAGAERRGLGRHIPRVKPPPGAPRCHGRLAGLIEHLATWPMTLLVDRYHRAGRQLPKLGANPPTTRGHSES
jgi:hypothetical protein